MTANRKSWLPVISLLAATVLYASSFIALKLAFRSFAPMFVMFGRMAVASVCFLFFLPSFLKKIDYRKGDIRRIVFMASFPTVFEPVGTMAVIYLGAGVSLVAYGCYNFGVSKLPASQATSFVNLIPIFTIIMGWLILGEKFNFMQYLAAATVLAGVLLSQHSAR
jgi:drug/metabolite transporter (DMT)-like permease